MGFWFIQHSAIHHSNGTKAANKTHKDYSKHQHWMIVLFKTPWNDDRDLNVTIKPRNIMRLSEYQPWLYQQTCPRRVGFPESAGTLSLLMSSPIASALHSESVWLWSQRKNYCIKTVLQHENEKPSITCIKKMTKIQCCIGLHKTCTIQVMYTFFVGYFSSKFRNFTYLNF